MQDDSRLPPPWLKIALDEMNHGVREDRRFKDAKNQYYLSAAKHLGETKAPLNLSTPSEEPKIQFLEKGIISANRSTVVDTLTRSDAAVSKYVKTVREGKTGPRFHSGIQETADGWEAVAWCAAFVNWCLAKAGCPHPDFAAAKDWIDFGTPLAHPQKGCIVVFRKLADHGSSTGHVAFYLHDEGDQVWVVGGNQSGSVRKQHYPKEKIRGFRWPPHQVKDS